MTAAPTTRARASNDATFLAGVDRRSSDARRYRDVVRAIVSDLGGDDVLSEAQRQIASKAAFLALRLEMMQCQSLAGGEIDLPLFGALADRLRRLLETLGLQRVPREVETLESYLSAKSRQRASVATGTTSCEESAT